MSPCFHFLCEKEKRLMRRTIPPINPAMPVPNALIPEPPTVKHAEEKAKDPSSLSSFLPTMGCWSANNGSIVAGTIGQSPEWQEDVVLQELVKKRCAAMLLGRRRPLLFVGSRRRGNGRRNGIGG